MTGMDIADEASVNSLIQNGSLTIPTTLSQEKAINPFLRCSHQAVRQAFAGQLADLTEESVFTELRKLKNAF